jgi:hypothetical protein
LPALFPEFDTRSWLLPKTVSPNVMQPGYDVNNLARNYQIMSWLEMKVSWVQSFLNTTIKRVAPAKVKNEGLENVMVLPQNSK